MGPPVMAAAKAVGISHKIMGNFTDIHYGRYFLQIMFRMHGRGSAKSVSRLPQLPPNSTILSMVWQQVAEGVFTSVTSTPQVFRISTAHFTVSRFLVGSTSPAVSS